MYPEEGEDAQKVNLVEAGDGRVEMGLR